MCKWFCPEGQRRHLHRWLGQLLSNIIGLSLPLASNRPDATVGIVLIVEFTEWSLLVELML